MWIGKHPANGGHLVAGSWRVMTARTIRPLPDEQAWSSAGGVRGMPWDWKQRRKTCFVCKIRGKHNLLDLLVFLSLLMRQALNQMMMQQMVVPMAAMSQVQVQACFQEFLSARKMVQQRAMWR